MGFIWCDSYVCRRDRSKNNFFTYEFKLSLAEKDKEHLDKIKLFLNSTHPIKMYKSKNGFKKEGEEFITEYRLYICNNYFAGNLFNNFGLIPHRFEINKLINHIPEIYYKDFIRGILDADGSLRSGYTYRSNGVVEYQCHIKFYTYIELLQFIQNIFLKEKLINVESKFKKRHEGKDGECSGLTYCGALQVPKILNWLYKDATVYLDRKYNIYLDIKNNTYNKNINILEGNNTYDYINA